MKRKFQLGKLLTNDGSSGVLMVLIFSAVLIFLIMPLVALTFEKTLVGLMVEDVQETLSLNSFEIYQKLEIKALGKGELKLPENISRDLSEMLSNLYHHPQLNKIEVTCVSLLDQTISLTVYIVLEPTLYRSIYDINDGHEFIYIIEMPMDRKDTL